MTRIACTEIGGRIMAGRANKAGDSFTGTPKDVTSDVLKTVIDKLDVAAILGNSQTWQRSGFPSSVVAKPSSLIWVTLAFAFRPPTQSLL